MSVLQLLTCFFILSSYFSIYQKNQFLELQNEFVREVKFGLLLFTTFIMVYEFAFNSLKSPAIRNKKGRNSKKKKN